MLSFLDNGLAFAESLSPVTDERIEVFSLQAMVRHSRVSWEIGKLKKLTPLFMFSSILVYNIFGSRMAYGVLMDLTCCGFNQLKLCHPTSGRNCCALMPSLLILK